MAAVTANQLRPRCQDPGMLRHCGVLTNIHLYSGTMAFYDATTGYLTDDDASGANKFAGIVENEVDATGSASGAKVAEVWTGGSYEVGVGSGFTQADARKPVYATSNNDITLTATNATRIGTSDGFVSATKLSVRLLMHDDLIV
jgi:hypothetical protein